MGIYKRSKSKYYWMSLGRPGAKPIRKSTRVPIAAETPGERRDQRALAERIYNAAMGDLARRRFNLPEADPTVISFDDYADWYEKNVTVHKRCAARERSAIKRLRADFKGLDLREIDKDKVRERCTARRRVVKASTVNRELDVLKHMLKEAVPKYLERSPIVGLNRMRAAKAPVRIFTEKEEIDFFAAAQTLEEQALMLIARDTLMRLSDVKNLQWKDYRGEYIAVIDPKVEPYIVPVTDRLRDVMDALPRESRYVFARRQRGPGSLSSNTVHRIFVDMCKRAGIPQGRAKAGVTFHSLRHTGTTRALERGVPARAVQAAGGWHSGKQLERYGHVTDAGLRAFRDKVGGEKMPAPGGDKPGTVH